MLNPSTDPDFSGRINPPNANFPNGSARDATVENDPAATPLLAKKFNDDWGYDAALLDAAGLSPDGLPDTAQASQRLSALNLIAISRSLNVLADEVIPTTNTVDVLDAVLYIYDQVSQIVYNKPYDVGVGEKIVSTTGDQLLTTATSYTMIRVAPLGFISSSNLLQNPTFVVPGSTAVKPSATPTNYIAEEEVFKDWFVSVGGVTNLTYVGGQWNCDSGSLYQKVQKDGAISSVTGFSVSVQPLVGKVNNTGVSFSFASDEFTVVVDSNATDVFSVKFKTGQYNDSHDPVNFLTTYGSPSVLGYYNVKSSGAGNGDVVADTKAIKDAFSRADGIVTIPPGVYYISETIVGRPKQVNAFGAILKPTGSFAMFDIQMYSGQWNGGFIDYRDLTALQIDENAVGIYFFKSSAPSPSSQVQHTSFNNLLLRGVHTGFKASPNTGLTWHTEFHNIEVDCNPGSSVIKSIGFDIEADGGLAGGSTTLRFDKTSVQDFSGRPAGAGHRGYRVWNLSGVEFKQVSFDGAVVDAGDALECFVNRLEINGFHTEQMTNNTAIGADGPFHIRANIASIEGIIMLTSRTIVDSAWFTFEGPCTLTFESIYNRVAGGETEFQYTIDTLLNPDLTIISTGNLTDALIANLKRETKVFFSRASADNTASKVQLASTGTIHVVPDKYPSQDLIVRGDFVTDGALAFTSKLTVVKGANNTGTAVIDTTAQTTSLPSTSFPITYTAVGNDIIWSIGGTMGLFDIQVQIVSQLRNAVAW